eukprot:CAMPEP_0172312780 /NCGR_PEP_ID=MMETSP1058-20130122/18559_1 /TAXON_ID=83371 /ORGANISM="Detonula confervacea, Strain CCMP 353" /LENGTH=199 /DNA_ID=CAMNT_0013026325 /DNA_START=25 /DNA_END=624 /DNA_ORIENTATION=+
MASIPASSTKRALKDVNGGVGAVAAKKPKTATAASVRKKDMQMIKSILGDIKDPVIKKALENIIEDPTKAAAVVSPKKDEATLEKMTETTIRTIQRLMNDKLKWKSSYSQLKGGGTKGGRLEVVCSEPEVFERIFKGATIKKGKDGKLSCSMKTEDDAEKCNLPFEGKSYRYNSSYLCAPFSSSLKDNTLTFSFKFGIS